MYGRWYRGFRINAGRGSSTPAGRVFLFFITSSPKAEIELIIY